MSDRLLISLIFIFAFCSFQGYHTGSHGVYSTIDDVEGDFISRKGSGFANSYLGSNSLGTLGKRSVKTGKSFGREFKCKIILWDFNGLEIRFYSLLCCCFVAGITAIPRTAFLILLARSGLF